MAEFTLTDLAVINNAIALAQCLLIGFAIGMKSGFNLRRRIQCEYS